jgi:hypothetical protein
MRAWRLPRIGYLVYGIFTSIVGLCNKAKAAEEKTIEAIWGMGSTFSHLPSRCAGKTTGAREQDFDWERTELAVCLKPPPILFAPPRD